MSRPSAERLALLRRELVARGLAAPRAAGIPRRPDRSRAPLTRNQERLFFLELYRPGTALHNDSLLVRVAGELDPELVRAALAELAARHAALRTSCGLASAGPEQRIHASIELPLRILELRDQSDEEVRELLLADARAPFELERAPLWRALLVRRGDREWLLALTMHHIVSDGASYGILYRELGHLYSARASGRTSVLPPPGPEPGDFAQAERTGEDRERLAAGLAFWKEHLMGARTPLCWPGAAATASGTGAQQPVRVAAELVQELGRLARSQQATSSQLLLAAQLVLLWSTTGAQDMCLALASSQRKRPELAGTVGFFVQTVPLRLRLDPGQPLLELLARVRATMLAGAAHEEVPLEHVLRALGDSAGAAVAPPQVCFSHMKDLIEAPRFPGARTSFEFLDPGVARFELSLVLHESAAGITGFLEHDLALLAPAAARDLAARYTRILEGIARAPEATPAELAPAVRRRSPPLPGRLRRAAGG
jgi:hypothetical protein